MEFVYVVRGEAGAYSDQSHWVAAVCETEAAAEAHAQFLRDKYDALCADFRKHNDSPVRMDGVSSSDYWKRPEVRKWHDDRLALIYAASEAMEEHDPHFSGSPGDVEYEVVKVRMVRA